MLDFEFEFDERLEKFGNASILSLELRVETSATNSSSVYRKM